MSTETQLLKDPSVLPDEKSVREALGEKIYPVYPELIKKIDTLGFTHEWNYYKDGKAWLCKVVYKKKTVFWLSIWHQYVKVGFYFTEKYLEAVNQLDIDSGIKRRFLENKPIGKLIPLIMDIKSVDQLEDLNKVALFKSRI